MGLFFRAFDVVAVAHAALREHAVELGQVGAGQRSVHAQLVDRDVVEMRAEESLRLGTEFFEIGTDIEARQLNAQLRTEDIFKTGIDDLSVLLIDELYESAQTPADALERSIGWNLK